MAKPAKVKVRVSTQPVVLMEAEVLRKIRQHARTSMKAEVCGVLIGNSENERMTVEACIAGINAAQGGAHVTFTQDTWEHIYKVKDKDFPDHKIVGWYHSHPGFGVFLSEHDLFIQQNFFSNPQQVAWVFDPHTDEEGCFGWIGGNIEKLSDIRVGYSQAVEITESGLSDYEENDEALAMDSMARSAHNKLSQKKEGPREPEWMKWATRALGYMATLFLGVVLCFVFLWFFTPIFDKARRYDQIIDQLRQYQEQQQRMLDGSDGAGAASPGLTANPGSGAVNPSPSANTTSPNQAQSQQTSPQQKGSGKENDKGTNGKH